MRARITAMRLMSSEMPCQNRSTNPMRMSDFAGHCGSPPAFIDCSLSRKDLMKNGTDVTIMTIVIGNRKNTWPKTSMESRQRFGSMPLTTSIRMCSLDRRVHGEHKRNIAPNRTHCSSSHEFDEVSKTLRTVALVDEMTTTLRISQDKTLPIRKLTASMARLSLSKPSTHVPLDLVGVVAEPPVPTPTFGPDGAAAGTSEPS